MSEPPGPPEAAPDDEKQRLRAALERLAAAVQGHLTGARKVELAEWQEILGQARSALAGARSVRLGRRTYSTADGSQFREVLIEDSRGKVHHVDVRTARRGEAQETRAEVIEQLALEEFYHRGGG